MRKYSNFETAIANIPYIAMILIGSLTIVSVHAFSTYGFLGAGAYLAYGVVGALWIMIFVCPYCLYYATRGCPCGYGVISAVLVKKGNRNCFSEKFKRHIPVIVPLWIIPVAYGVIGLWRSFSWWLLSLVLVFVIESCVILPIVSRKHGCVECPQKDQCPWMGKYTKSTQQSAAAEIYSASLRKFG